MSIKSRLLLFALCISLIPISIITTLYYFNARSVIERQTLEWLTAVAESKKVHTESFLNAKKGRAVDFSSDGYIRDSLEKISKGNGQGSEASNLNRHLKVNKKSLDPHITSIAVLDINGMVVASTTDGWVGNDMSEEDIFKSCLGKEYGEAYSGKLFNSPYLNTDCVFISSPLTSKHDYKTIGVIINAYDIAILDEITTRRSGMGETGEALLGMKNKNSVVFLTTLKHAPGMPLRMSVPLSSTGAEPMRLALKGQNGTITAHDYRGKDVVASYQYIPGMDWGLVTKIDETEVFSPITRLRKFTIFMGTISTIVVIVIVVSMSRRVTRPLQKLVEGTQMVASGDLDFNIQLRSKDEIGQLAASFNDMTSQLGKTREELDNYAHNLEEMVENKTQEIKQMLDELKYKNKEMEQIIYVASHDLRSPLLNIHGFSKELEESMEQIRNILNDNDITDEIREKFADPLEHDIPDALRFILKSSSKMDRLLSGLLRISRLGRKAINIKQLDMNKLITDVIAACEYQIKSSNVKLECGELPSCRGDEVQINQVFSNLIDNAVKYLDSSREGILKVSGRKEGGHIIYCIKDNGIGIEEGHEENIFEIFHRLHPTSNDVEGEGLGLSIVRRILDRHGGNIWVESELGKGSKFFVSLPE